MIKRCFDVVIAAVALVAVSPILAIAAIAIKIESRGPVLHRAMRVGRNQDPFVLLKLRSMRVGTTDSGPGVTASHDSRITRVGRVCRRFKLDELPQLWNVIRGDMSLVGPRPEDARYLPQYTSEQLALFGWRPGITSPASVEYRDEEGVLATMVKEGRDLDAAYRHVQQDKLRIELDYFPHATFRSDLVWLFRTVAAVAR